jgi:neutral ceramidase
MRLHVRALVLTDRNGETVAILVADLPHLSPNLHRQTADRVAKQTGIGADRLILSATHTHAGPGHHYAERQYNQYVSQVAGYDPAMVEFLVSRFAQAILDAHGRLRAARIAWRMTPVWGHTRNRSYDAYVRNKPEGAPPFPPPAGLEPARVAVDPTWTMLRVDTLGADGAHHPAGAFSIFAFHGTGNPPDNDLFDPDIQGIVNRRVERHIDSLNGRHPTFGTEAIHLLANGTEGDISPDWPPNSRCDLPLLRPTIGPGGPRTPPAPWEWRQTPRAHVALCLATARAYVNAVGDTLGRRAAALFDSIGAKLTDTHRIAVAFRTVRLRGYHGLCADPAIGASTAAGAEDGPTRLRGWRLFGFFSFGFEEGGRAVRKDPRNSCQREKHVLGEGMQRKSFGPFSGEHGLPEVAQLSVVRIGDLLLAVVPAEVTTVAGAAMKRAVRDSAHAHGLVPNGVAVIGLTNGYIQYATTDAEYSAQDYEGGSTLYGPKSAAVLAQELGRLAGQLGDAGGRSPVNVVDSLTAYPGDPISVLPDSAAGPPVQDVQRAFLALTCLGDTVVARWRDVYPGRLVPANEWVVQIERTSDGRWEPVVRDDDPYLEVRALGPAKGGGYLWELRWDAHPFPTGQVRVVLLPRSLLPAVVSGSCMRTARDQ